MTTPNLEDRSPEALARRAARRQAHARMARTGRDCDLLAERARVIAFWKKCAETNRGYAPYNGAWWHVFTWNPAFRRLCLPGLRAMLDAQDKAFKQRLAAESRAYSEKCAQAKAERAAAKLRAESPQKDLLC